MMGSWNHLYKWLRIHENQFQFESQITFVWNISKKDSFATASQAQHKMKSEKASEEQKKKEEKINYHNKTTWRWFHSFLSLSLISCFAFHARFNFSLPTTMENKNTYGNHAR